MADPTTQTDVQLWRRAQAGDGTAFGDLFERHADRVYNYCFRRLGSWALAEDATSQSFTEAWRRRDAVEVDDSLLPWLFAVANNVCRNLARSGRRHAHLLSTIPQVGPVVDHADEVASRIDDERQMQQVLAALRKLKQSDRDVIAMCDWEGLSYNDTARALGVAVGTVKSRLSRARQRLRESVVDLGRGQVDVDSTMRVDESRGELS